MADRSLQPILDELNGTAAVKPFECVGTVEEVNACLAATTNAPEPVEGPTVDEILSRFNTNHFLPEKFEQILKSRLHV